MDNNYREGSARATTVKAIESAVAYFFGMRTDELHQKSMTRAVVVPRQIAMYLIKQMTDASVPQIARYYARKRSATVERAIGKLEEQRCKNGVVDLVIRELVEQTEMRLAVKEGDSVTLIAGQSSFADKRLMRKIQDRLAKTSGHTEAAGQSAWRQRQDNGDPPLPCLYQG
jgi:hypothetical protein